MAGSEIEKTIIINQESLWVGTYLSLILGWILAVIFKTLYDHPIPISRIRYGIFVVILSIIIIITSLLYFNNFTDNYMKSIKILLPALLLPFTLVIYSILEYIDLAYLIFVLLIPIIFKISMDNKGSVVIGLLFLAIYLYEVGIRLYYTYIIWDHPIDWNIGVINASLSNFMAYSIPLLVIFSNLRYLPSKLINWVQIPIHWLISMLIMIIIIYINRGF